MIAYYHAPDPYRLMNAVMSYYTLVAGHQVQCVQEIPCSALTAIVTLPYTVLVEHLVVEDLRRRRVGLRGVARKHDLPLGWVRSLGRQHKLCL